MSDLKEFVRAVLIAIVCLIGMSILVLTSVSLPAPYFKRVSTHPSYSRSRTVAAGLRRKIAVTLLPDVEGSCSTAALRSDPSLRRQDAASTLLAEHCLIAMRPST